MAELSVLSTSALPSPCSPGLDVGMEQKQSYSSLVTIISNSSQKLTAFKKGITSLMQV
jgi:hypothetical protein